MLITAFLMVVPIGVKAQTAEDLTVRYRTPINAYEVRPGILMTVKYGTDGQVCEMVVERRHTTDSGVNLSSSLPKKLIDELIDELAPTYKRGERIDKSISGKYYLETAIDGRITSTERNYEHAVIIIIGAISTSGCESGDVVLIIKWKPEF